MNPWSDFGGATPDYDKNFPAVSGVVFENSINPWGFAIVIRPVQLFARVSVAVRMGSASYAGSTLWSPFPGRQQISEPWKQLPFFIGKNRRKKRGITPADWQWKKSS